MVPKPWRLPYDRFPGLTGRAHWLALVVIGSLTLLWPRVNIRRALSDPQHFRLASGVHEVGEIRLPTSTFEEIAAGGERLGRPNSPVRLVVFGSYACGYCIQLSKVIDSLLASYPAQLEVVMRDFVPYPTRLTLNWHLGAHWFFSCVGCLRKAHRLLEDARAVMTVQLDSVSSRSPIRGASPGSQGSARREGWKLLI